MIAVIIGTSSGVLYYGRVTEAVIPPDCIVRLERSRHIAKWVSGRGGITALAALGPLAGSRIGAEAPFSIVSKASAIHAVSPLAELAFDAYVTPQE
jgi:hypothetical protein